MEDAATEFQVQGLELDWVCVTWDADFRFAKTDWNCHSFVASRWQTMKKPDRRMYLRNAYRVLLTRAPITVCHWRAEEVGCARDLVPRPQRSRTSRHAT